MIIHASMRTDIPAFYSEWFTNRIREGYVRVRNPYDPLQVTEYSLDPEVVDLIVFCSKNPVPMLKYMDLLKSYRTYWYITITPYEADIEPGLFKTIGRYQSANKISGCNSKDFAYGSSCGKDFCLCF